MAYIPITDDQAEAFDTLEQIADKKILSEEEYKKAKAAGEKIEKQIVRPIVASEALQAEMEQEVASNISKRKQQHQIDTSAPDFDIKGFTESIKAAATNIEISLQSFVTAMKEANKSLGSQGAIQATFDALKATRAALTENMPAFSQSLKLIDERWKAIEAAHKEGFWDYYIELEMYILIELDIAAESSPEFAKYTTFDVAEYGFTPEGEPAEGIFKDIIERAIRRRREYEQGEAMIEMLSVTMERTEKAIAKAEAKANTPKYTLKPTDLIGASVDKLSLITFGSATELITGQQYKIDTLGNSKYPIIYRVYFDEELDIQTSKDIDYYDEYVAAVATALDEANGISTESQICKMMGLGNNQRNRAEIRTSMEKQRLTIVEINTTNEAEHSNYPKYIYDDSLLSFKRVRAEINGKITDSAIQLKGTPPLIEMARGRHQYDDVPRAVLDVPLPKKTRRNVGLIYYLAKRVCQIKRGHGQPKMLYTSLCAEFKVSANHKSEFLETVKKILFHFKRESFIDSYDAGADKFTIHVTKKIAGGKNKKLT